MLHTLNYTIFQGTVLKRRITEKDEYRHYTRQRCETVARRNLLLPSYILNFANISVSFR